MSDRFFCFEYRVLYALCTLVNHVYYARYLEFLVAARAESVVCYGGHP
jgi:acyl-CoA thioesterase FadM